MISFADTAWEVFSLAGVFTLGLAVLPILSPRLGVTSHYGLALYLWHSLFCAIYILYSMSNPADSLKYFITSLTWDSSPALGTRFVIFFNSLFTQGLGLSYGGTFFVYNLLGTIGLVAFSAAMREGFATKARRVRRLVTILPFLPGFSFWSTAIGKDSLAFFGVGLICWATAQPYRRFPAALVGFITMLAVRPHMAGFLLIALAVSYSLVREGSVKQKLLVNTIVLPASVAVVALSISYVGLGDGVSGAALSAYVEQRQHYNTEGGSSVDIANSSVPMRMFMYVFRPLFFDAGGAFGMVVSLENLILFGVFLGAMHGLLKRCSSLSKFQRVFFSVYVLISWLALANTTANLGIAIRQKTMFTPMMLMLMLSYLPNVGHASVKRKLPTSRADARSPRFSYALMEPTPCRPPLK